MREFKVNMHDADSSINDSFEESFDGRKDNFDSSHNSSNFKGHNFADDHRPGVNLYSAESHYQNELSASNDYDDSDHDEPSHSPHKAYLKEESYHHSGYVDEHDDEPPSDHSSFKRQESEHAKLDTSGFKYKQSTEDLEDEYHHVEHRHVEFQDEEDASPVATSSLQNSFKLEKKKSVESVEALQFKFTANYQMSEKEFKAQKTFFDRIQGGGRASVKLVGKLLVQQVTRKPGVIQANGDDIERALHAIDSDTDGLITFNEFVDLLQLFFAKSTNVGERIEMMLNNRSFSNLKSYSLSPDEAKSFVDFLDDFYGIPQNTSYALRNRPELSERISNTKFAELASPIYSQFTYLA